MTTFGVGSALREERLRLGLSLEEIATQTKISRRFLEAIEAEDFASLPGTLFARNFVRQFAFSLGMDSDSLLAGLPKVDIGSIPLPASAQFARPRRRDPRWANVLSSFLWIALTGGVSAGAWVYFQPKPNSAPRTVESAMIIPALAANYPPAMPSVENVSGDPVPVKATAADSGPGKEPVQVVLKAREASWVQIIADGKNAFTGILHPNDSRAVAANALVRVTAGNAGGLEISLNGKSIDPLGPSGQVRTVRFTAEGPQIVMKGSPTTSAPL